MGVKRTTQCDERTFRDGSTHLLEVGVMSKDEEPRRVRWSVPRADISTNQWLDEQHSISESLRFLIRESIQRDGYIDVVNKPVEQQPRRGRPSKSESVEAIRPVGDVDPDRGREMVRAVLIEHFDADPADAERAAGEVFAPTDRSGDDVGLGGASSFAKSSPDSGLDEGGQLDMNALMRQSRT